MARIRKGLEFSLSGKLSDGHQIGPNLEQFLILRNATSFGSYLLH